MIPVVARATKEIPRTLIDRPTYLMREVDHNDAYAELRESIRVHGVQQALIVEVNGERFTLIAGNRRLTVADELGAETVPCDIRPAGAGNDEAIKIIENDEREKANPADVALYLARLFVERCHNDVDRLCALTHRTRKYVEDRLVLLQGDEQIFDALRARVIGLGVALELNQITDIGYRRLHLDNALRFGMTVDAARQARRESNRVVEMSARAADTPGGAAVAMPTIAEARNVCTCCLKSDHPERMRWVPVHEYCQLAVLEPMLSPWRAARAETVDA